MPVPIGIKTAFQAFCTVTVEKRSEERQEHWHLHTKELIFRTLSAVGAELKLQVFKDQRDRNLELVGFELPTKTNPIVVKLARPPIVLTKIGGSFYYSQAFNGKIYVAMTYPFVRNSQKKDDYKTGEIGLLDPEQITEKLIYEHVELFFKKTTEHENIASFEDEDLKRKPFGFRPPEKSESA